MEPAIRERVRFVVAIGGYYDLPAVLTFFTTGYFRDAGEWRYLGSNPYASWIFVRSNLERLESASDREILASMASRRLADPQASLADLAAQLGPEGRAVYGFVNNADPDRAPALFRALPASVRQDVAALDLRNKDLGALSARLILVHGRGDTMIPYTQSVALARAVSPGQAKLFLAGGLGHVELQGRWWEAWTLWRAASALLSERDQG
jgi:pimeloyl-ACP methyl ester carboxylesterase